MDQANSTTTRTRSVTFTQFSELVHIPQDNGVWYSPADTRNFQRALIQDVRRLSREIGGAEDDIPMDRLIECLGIEVFLSNRLAMRVQETRDAHINAILSEQRLQRLHGIMDIEKLANISKRTEWTAERARTLANTYWEHSTSET